MPELLLHFSILFTVAAPVLGLRRAILVGFIAILLDADVLISIHRSFTHSIILISILAVFSVYALWRLEEVYQ